MDDRLKRSSLKLVDIATFTGCSTELRAQPAGHGRRPSLTNVLREGILTTLTWDIENGEQHRETVLALEVDRHFS